jgi:flagellar basal-body rod modification protein FlgD
MSTTPTSGFTGVNGTQGTTLAPSSNNSTQGTLLDKNAFLKLMMVELQQQDPLNPSSQDPTQYLQQLAQMTTLEQETNIATSSAQSAASSAATSAIALLGHTVSYVDPNGNPQSGVVQTVDMTSGTPLLTISGVAGISPSAISQIS